MLESIVFWSLTGLALLSALAVVTLRNTMHCALFLGLALAGVAGLFASLGADFLFAAQIMVYVSGIAVLILFAVMLLGRASDLHLRQVNELWLVALLICLVAGAGLFAAALAFGQVLAAAPPTPGGTRAIGRLMLGDYLVPFELVSLALTAALLGAVFFARAERPEVRQ